MCWFASVSLDSQYCANCLVSHRLSHNVPFPHPTFSETVSCSFLWCNHCFASPSILKNSPRQVCSCKTGPDCNCQRVGVCECLCVMCVILHPSSHSWTLHAGPHLKANPCKISRWERVSCHQHKASLDALGSQEAPLLHRLCTWGKVLCLYSKEVSAQETRCNADDFQFNFRWILTTIQGD